MKNIDNPSWKLSRTLHIVPKSNLGIFDVQQMRVLVRLWLFFFIESTVVCFVYAPTTKKKPNCQRMVNSIEYEKSI